MPRARREGTCRAGPAPPWIGHTIGLQAPVTAQSWHSHSITATDGGSGMPSDCKHRSQHSHSIVTAQPQTLDQSHHRITSASQHPVSMARTRAHGTARAQCAQSLKTREKGTKRMSKLSHLTPHPTPLPLPPPPPPTTSHITRHTDHTLPMLQNTSHNDVEVTVPSPRPSTTHPPSYQPTTHPPGWPSPL